MNSNMKNDQIPNEPLPKGFTPGNRDVVIGKGKKFFKHEGNRYLRTLIASMLEEYSMAQTKPDKSNIISDVVDHVRKTGRFVKKHPSTGEWVYAEDLLCREKCSQCFRDALHQTYRSSNVAKKNKRRRELEMQYQQEVLEADAMMMWPPEAKRMRPNPVPVAPVPTPQHLFDWEMSPMSPKPRIFRRASDLTGNMVSLLVDAFGGFGHSANQDENPFEPTPLPYAPNLQGVDDFWNNTNSDAHMKSAGKSVGFEHKHLLDSLLLQDDSLQDISFKSDFMDGSFPFQPQSQQGGDYQKRGPNTAAAFAA